MAPFLERLIAAQAKRPLVYAEPFAGGAGAALTLLATGAVERAALNDLNRGIAEFWRAIFDETDRFIEAIWSAELTLTTWHRHREAYLDEHTDPFDRGFATFFLNRTNRSGILGARPIGGLEQLGAWKLDARFNKSNLAERVANVGAFRDRVSISQLDGKDFLDRLDTERDHTLFYVDPPYLKQGEDLYLANMTYRDHINLARTLRRMRSPWVLTYDRDDRVPDELYSGLPCASFSISHTAAKQHIGSEYLVVPKSVAVDSLDGFGPRPGAWLAGRSPEELAG